MDVSPFSAHAVARGFGRCEGEGARGNWRASRARTGDRVAIAIAHCLNVPIVLDRPDGRVEDGLLVLPKGRGGKLLTEKQFDNFILRFDFKLTSGANNGLAIRAPIKGDAAYNAIELQILDNSSDRWPNLKPYQTHGSIYGVAPAKRGFLKPVGEWNAQEVRCNGRNIHVILNGHTILNANLDQVTSTGKTIDGQPHPGLKNTEGHLGFLGHGDRVAFRNIRIRPLNPDQ